MKIAVDFREAARSRRAGKGEYVFELVRAWLPLIKDSQTKLILLTHTGQAVDLPPGAWCQRAFGGGLLWHTQVWLWLELLRPVDVYFATTSFIIPACLRSLPSVTTIFDFAVWRHSYSQAKTSWLEKLMAGAAFRFSRHLLAISEFTKQEAIKLFQIPADKITVTLMAAAGQYRPLILDKLEIAKLRGKYNLPDKFILYLGTLEPRKNILGIIEAFQQIKNQISGVKLVLAGSKGWRTNNIIKAAKAEDIIMTGYVGYRDKPALYNLAKVFVFPSFYEGFGMPPLEAMACGTPTIVSNSASLPEVVGKAAKIIPAQDTGALARTMKEILINPHLQQELSRSGITQAKEFSWRGTAQQTWQILQSYGSR